MTCKLCGKQINNRRSVAKFCSSECQKKSYNASDIKIIRDDQIENFPALEWVSAEKLAAKYNKPLEWIKRSLDACDEAGESYDYFINRYLKEDKTIPMNSEVGKISLRLQQGAQRQ